MCDSSCREAYKYLQTPQDTSIQPFDRSLHWHQESPTFQMAMISSEQGWVSLGPWGGKSGEYSAYKATGPIMQITIRHGDVIDSILFESQSYNGNVIGSSVKIGGTGGSLFAKGNVGNEGGCISLGLEGGKEGAYWAYKADEPIMVISIRYGEAIDSILFQSRTGNKLGRTMKIGDNGGGTTKTVGHSIAHSWI
ncbi:hypothetical protein RHSIM_Rhsim12G0044700 [Rhododendron simsii]|uniref:Jacalin-type lectin domain-containing protein n=1 Tax=Rhododendron simsii TaxID=118357 RepID=A0A834G4G5_RHOSS|nr:hypothetical protein RHSIM_Rhsim12G0044700 [Rhododendron simsii]